MGTGVVITTKPTPEQYMAYIQQDYSALGVVLSALGLVLVFIFFERLQRPAWMGVCALLLSIIFFSSLDAVLYFHTWSRGGEWPPPVMSYPQGLCGYRIVQTTIQNMIGLWLLFYIGWKEAGLFYLNHLTGLYDLTYYVLLKDPIQWAGYDYFWLSWTLPGWFGLREGYHIAIAASLGIAISIYVLIRFQQYGSTFNDWRRN